jgi:glycosyltransferase involved in cell wall biosynthesis
LQAQACGTPVIAFGKGMALETVVPLGDAKPSGVYFGQQTIEAINAAIDRFERNRMQITPAACRANAERFSPAIFRRAFMAEMTRTIAASSLRAAAARRVESEAEANDANSTLRRPVEPAHKSITRH